MSDVTRVFETISRGEANATDQLLPSVYQELRKLAAAKMALESPGQTLQPTALVHEVWLRIGGQQDKKWNDRGHFFAAAAEAMRWILVDNARRKRAARHGGGRQPIELHEAAAEATTSDGDLILAVNDALQKFTALDPQKAELVKLRYFVGMTNEEAAEVLGISVTSVKRYWAYARAWLATEIRAHQPSG